MIYIIEIPHQTDPVVWSRDTKEEIMDVINLTSNRSGDIIYDASTGQELLDRYGYDTAANMCASNIERTQAANDDLELSQDELFLLGDLIAANGIDTTYYTEYSDEGRYGITPIDEWQAYLRWNAHDLNKQLVFMDDDEARAALTDNAIWNVHQGVKARIALKRKLKELEI